MQRLIDWILRRNVLPKKNKHYRWENRCATVLKPKKWTGTKIEYDPATAFDTEEYILSYNYMVDPPHLAESAEFDIYAGKILLSIILDDSRRKNS